jgi:hypothetical protein
MLILLGLVTTSPQCVASLIVTFSASGVQNTTAAGASVFTFDSLSAGLNTNVTWTGEGSFDKVYANAADQYGGAGGTGKYAVVGSQASSSSLLSSTLTLSAAQAYLGVWISAADANNGLDLYSGATKLVTISAATILTAVGACPNAFCGNPNGGQNAGEPYIYVNFFGTSGTTFNKVVFNNADYSTGFEYDNVAVSTAPGVVTGTVIGTYATPEPGTLFLMASLLIAGSPAARKITGRRTKSAR